MPSYRFRLNYPPYPMVTIEAESEYAAEYDLHQFVQAAGSQRSAWDLKEPEFDRVKSSKPLPKIPSRF